MKKLLIIIIIFSFISTSYSVEESKENDLKQSIDNIQKWVSSLADKDEKQIKQLFPKQKPVRSTWEFNKKKELVLEYKFYSNTVLLHFIGNKTINASIQLLSK